MRRRTCTACKRHRSLSKFPPDRRSPDGVQARCRECINHWMKTHYHGHPVEYMIRRAKARASRKGLEFALTVEDILPLPVRCPVLGIKLTRGNGQQCPTGYSLDRIDNRKGYVPGNVAVVSYLANRLKNDGTAEQHILIAEWMLGQKAS